MTFNELINEAMKIAGEHRDACSALGRDWMISEQSREDCNRAAREFALAITHLEDALTRYNGGRYRENRTWKRADPDKA